MKLCVFCSPLPKVRHSLTAICPTHRLCWPVLLASWETHLVHIFQKGQLEVPFQAEGRVCRPLSSWTCPPLTADPVSSWSSRAIVISFQDDFSWVCVFLLHRFKKCFLLLLFFLFSKTTLFMTHIKKKPPTPWKWAKKINKIHLPPPCPHFLPFPPNKREKKAKENKTKQKTEKQKTPQNPPKQGSAFPQGKREFTLEPLGVDRRSSSYRNLQRKTLKTEKETQKETK